MNYDGFVGPSYNLDSKKIGVQRTVNLHPVLIQSGLGKDGAKFALEGTPGLEELFDLTTGEVRAIFYPKKNDPDSRITDTFLIVIKGNEVFRCTYNGSTWTTNSMSSANVSGSNEYLVTSSGPISIRQVETDPFIVKAIVCDGSESPYEIRIAYNEVSEEVEYLFFAQSNGSLFYVENANRVSWIDGYMVFTNGTGNFFTSELGNLTVDPLSFANSEGNPDDIVSQIENHRYLWLFNEKTTEIFTNTGNADFPFERVSGGYLEIGCVAQESVSKIGGTIFWLGRTEEGEGVVYKASSTSPEKISTNAIEREIKTYADISSARSYTYELEGKAFYVLIFDEATWVYDLTLGQWHERAYLNGGSFERHRAQVCTYVKELGLHIVGDYENGKVYAMKNDVYSDNGDPIKRLRVAPHISNENKNVFYDEFMLDMEVGVGLESGQGSDPQVMMRFSNDGGYTWSDESWTSAGGKVGGVGEYEKRVIWRRLGMARDRVFEISISDPVKVCILGAKLKVRGGKS